MKSLHFGPTPPLDPDPMPIAAAPTPSQPVPTPEPISLPPYPVPEPVLDATRPLANYVREVPVAEFDWKRKRKPVKVVCVIQYCGQFGRKDVRDDEKVMLVPEGRFDLGLMVRRCRKCQHLFVPVKRMSLDCPKCWIACIPALKDAKLKTEVRKMIEWIYANGKEAAGLIGDRPDVAQNFEFGGFGQIRCTPRVRYFAQLLAQGYQPSVAAYLANIPPVVATDLMNGNGNPRKFNEIRGYYANRHICVQIAAELSEMEAQIREGTSVNAKGKVLDKMPTIERMKLMQRKAELWSLYLEHHAKEPDLDVSLGALDDILPAGTTARQAGDEMLRTIARDATGLVGLYGFGMDKHQ